MFNGCLNMCLTYLLTYMMTKNILIKLCKNYKIGIKFNFTLEQWCNHSYVLSVMFLTHVSADFYKLFNIYVYQNLIHVLKIYPMFWYIPAKLTRHGLIGNIKGEGKSRYFTVWHQ